MRLAFTPNCFSASVDGAVQPADHRVKRHAARRVALRIEKHLDMPDIVGVGALQIGESQIVEILLGEQHRHALIIDVEKVLQVAKLIGLAHRFDRVEAQLDTVPARQREHQLRLEASFNVDVQLAFRQPFDQRIVLVHFRVSRGSCGGFEVPKIKRRTQIGTSNPKSRTSI